MAKTPIVTAENLRFCPDKRILLFDLFIDGKFHSITETPVSTLQAAFEKKGLGLIIPAGENNEL